MPRTLTAAPIAALGAIATLIGSASPALADETYTVHYHVESTGFKTVGISYEKPVFDENDSLAHLKNQSTPFDLDVEYTKHDIVSASVSVDALISIDNVVTGVDASVSCSIAINGEVVKENSGGSMTGCDYMRHVNS